MCLIVGVLYVYVCNYCVIWVYSVCCMFMSTMCIYVWACEYLGLYLYVLPCECMRIYLYVFVNIWDYICIWLCEYVKLYLYAWVCEYMTISKCVCLHYVCMYESTYACVFAYIYTYLYMRVYFLYRFLLHITLGVLKCDSKRADIFSSYSFSKTKS